MDLEQRLTELRVINRLGRVANSTLNMDKLLEQTFNETTELMEATIFAVVLYDAKLKQISIELMIENGQRYQRQVVDLGEGIASHIINTKQAVLFRDSAELIASRIPYVKIQDSLLPESYLGVPILIGDEVIGVLTVQHEKARAFDQHHAQVLTTVADQLASAIRNARIYADLERNFQAVREINRIKDEFLNNISHELRTPLTVIIGWGELMANGRLSEEQLRTAIDQINKSSQRLLALVSSLLDLSKIERGALKLDRRDIDINFAVQRAVDENSFDAATKNIDLKCEYGEELPMINGDCARLQQAVSNLLNNAIKFTHDGGLVVIRSEQYDNRIMISVTDNGIGIDQSKLPFIFERFSQGDGSTTRKYGGAGIGLSLVKSLIEMHGGEVVVDSEPGKGSTFSLLLPANGMALPEPEQQQVDVKQL
jgi:signal transduction histidine kinase